jgi:hypothetical protein
VLLLLSGCVGPYETRFLTWWQRPPEVESRSYDAHDPFGDKYAGPDTYSRPRAFIDPRSDTRKNAELSFLQAMHPTAGQPQLAGVPIVRGPAVPGPGGVPIATGPAPTVIQNGSPVANYPYPAVSTARNPSSVSPWASVPATVPY